LEWHEDAQPVAAADQARAVEVERDPTRRPLQPERDDNPAIVGELVDPGGRDVPASRRDDDPVERSSVGDPLFRVGPHHVDAVVACLVEEGAGALDDLGVGVHRGDVSAVADELGQQSRVVAAAAHLAHAHARFDVSRLQHGRLEMWRGHGADGQPVVAALDDRRDVHGVGNLQ
jgi:hypothetical protein